jgi:hypothetical protein
MTARPRPGALALAMALAACTALPPAGGAPAPPDLAAALLPRDGPVPPAEPPGACWEGAVIPAVVETVTEQVQVAPERRAPDGTPAAPAAFRTETRQRIVQDRRAVWFEALCAADLTPDLVATLQRALKARGLYPLPLTGAMDAPTRAAVRAWQRPRGLDSDVLSRAAARALGIVAAGRSG